MNMGMIYGAVAFGSLLLYAITIVLILKWPRVIWIWRIGWYGYIIATTMVHISSKVEKVKGGLSDLTWLLLVVWIVFHSIFSFGGLSLLGGDE